MAHLPSLPDAFWAAAGPVSRLFDVIEQEGAALRMVGGCIRNALLGRPITDVDFATTALPEEVMRRCRQEGLKVIPTGIAHGTVTVLLEGVSYEVTTLRRDVKPDGRRAQVAFGTDWTADALRRDFTINALYADRNGLLYDDVGGYDDLKSGSLRFIGIARDRIREDYLRILRLFRFAAQYPEFRLSPDDVEACGDEKVGLHHLSGERIRQEMGKLVAADRSASCLMMMHAAGILAELIPLPAHPRRVPSLLRLMERAEQEPDSLSGLAGLAGLAGLWCVVEGDVDPLAKRLRFSRKEANLLRAGLSVASSELQDGVPSWRRSLYRHGREAFLLGLMLRFARSDAPSATALALFDEALGFARAFDAPVFPVRGRDLIALGMARGPGLSVRLKALESLWVDSGFTLSQEDLLARVLSDPI